MGRAVTRRFVLATIAASLVGVPGAFGLAGASAAVEKSAASATTAIWPTVRPGARGASGTVTGERVRTIQYLLDQRGYRVAIDGVYGPSTTNAVKAFQRVNRLAQDGRVGPVTWPKLVVTVKRGSRGFPVLAVERWLRLVYGYKRVTIDGFFGFNDESTVKNVQLNHRLRIDGIVGSATWRVIVAGK